MPSRSIRASISNPAALSLCCLLALPAAAQELNPYDVTAVDQFSSGLKHGRTAYEGMERGDIDFEPMREVVPRDNNSSLPPVQVVAYSDPPPVYEVVVRPDAEPELFGEHKIFEQIRIDVEIAKCILRNICSEEVKKIPGVYFGDEQESDDTWQQGGADSGLEVLTEGPANTQDTQPSAPSGDNPQRPGRVFVEEPAPATDQ
ncbi:hypothetical protein [Marinobacterium stanieri]|uniref:Uncharacterized protein n=1 Tax=Marinobacterium stanieri TaxID=49186 RepID=A0A1N6N7K9_9GAMM|nr:hypothetical protein [Marinobacterium stanieri]SIP88022.1 hypothetical protein SAMN05421647_10196 [Marinobacterium stanieri]